jgi:hypothetical protein
MRVQLPKPSVILHERSTDGNAIRQGLPLREPNALVKVVQDQTQQVAVGDDNRRRANFW